MAEGGPPDCTAQKTEISALLKSPLQKGDTWYLIDIKWFKQWKKYAGYDSWDTSNMGDQSAYPGPIDNSGLYAEASSSALAENLMDELDYLLLPTEAWNKFVSWYGISDEQQPIARKVIEQGMFVKHCKVEVYLMDLKLCENSDPETIHTCQFSRADTIDFVMQEMKRVFNITDEREVRLWNKYMANAYEQLSKFENTVQDSGLYVGQTIVIEQKNEDGTWPRQTKSTSAISSGNTNSLDSGFGSGSSPRAGSSSSNSYSSYGGSTSYSGYGGNLRSDYRSTVKPGLCGLSNLGNTCFMNSALQCMSNVPELTQYFLDNLWEEELNEDNPLGMRGEIATSFAELVKIMWSGKNQYTIPRNFKIAVGRFAPQFSGYQQQDSQELMAFLLDGLHEDLNRIKKKPYVEQKDANDRPDGVVADEAWSNYRLRNDSVIVDTFHGLLKSTLVCPDCSKVSVTFDPFCYLSLPLPYKKERMIEVFFIPLDADKSTTQYKLTVPKMGCVADLCSALSQFTKVPTDKMVVADVYNHRFHKVFGPQEGLNHILDRDDIFIYEVPVQSGDDPDTLILPVYMREEKTQGQQSTYSQQSRHLFGQPLLVPVPRKSCTYDILYNILLKHMSRYVRTPHDNDTWWKEPEDCEKQDGEEQLEADDGEAEMKSEDAESQDKQEDGNEGGDDDTGASSSKNSAVRMFSMQLVNSYGNSEYDKLVDDERPLKLSNRSYIAIDWNRKAKEKFYDDKASEALEAHESVNQKPAKTSKVIQLNECLDLFTTKEKLGADDPWYCPQCKEHRRATKKFDLWSLPDVLVIHLKRFSYNRYWRDKLDTLVEYPTKSLSMKKWVINNDHDKSLVYDLISVSNHFGGMGGGHYTAYAKNHVDGEWYNFDDSSVSPTTEDSVVTKSGYVLVYQRRGVLKPQSPPRKMRICQTPAAAGGPCNSNGSNGNSNGSLSDDDDMDIN